MDAVRIAISPKITSSLVPLRSRYPTLSDAEIFKLSLARLHNEELMAGNDDDSSNAILRQAAWSMNIDGWLTDPAEDLYQPGLGKIAKW